MKYWGTELTLVTQHEGTLEYPLGIKVDRRGINEGLDGVNDSLQPVFVARERLGIFGGEFADLSAIFLGVSAEKKRPELASCRIRMKEGSVGVGIA